MLSSLVFSLLVVCLVPCLRVCASEEPFLWGAAGASYQIEGAWNLDGRLPSIWDTFCHNGNCADNSNGDVADDDYHRYVEDIKLVKRLGINAYRLSIAWPRIYPDGENLNQDGLDFYDTVIDEILSQGLIPFVTLYHWDIPQAVYDATDCGWLDSTVIPYFLTYAKTVFEHFGGRVTYWLSFNEPLTFCQNGYGTGAHAPGRCSDRSVCAEGDSGTEPYLCAHNVLLTHAQVVNMYRLDFQPTQKGKIGITLNGDWAYPMSQSEADQEAAERNVEFQIAWYADPVYFGDYPQSMKDYVGDRLPNFTEEQKSMLNGSSDFYGMNQYTGKWVADKPNQDGTESWGADQETDVTPQNYNGTYIGTEAASSWLWVTPTAIRHLLNWIWDRYDPGSIYITENGVDCVSEINGTLPDVLNDTCRVEYYQGYLEDNVMAAIKEDGVNVAGYFAWALMDNFEWADGYSRRFGLHYVDYDGNLDRYPKQSADWYSEFAKNNPEPRNN